MSVEIGKNFMDDLMILYQSDEISMKYRRVIL
jgi:hypothetical protein